MEVNSMDKNNPNRRSFYITDEDMVVVRRAASISGLSMSATIVEAVKLYLSVKVSKINIEGDGI
jgi:hypothetical protein